MLPAWMVSRFQLRRRWAPNVSLIVLVGLAGGVVLAAIAGDRRTDTVLNQTRRETLGVQ